MSNYHVNASSGIQYNLIQLECECVNGYFMLDITALDEQRYAIHATCKVLLKDMVEM